VYRYVYERGLVWTIILGSYQKQPNDDRSIQRKITSPIIICPRIKTKIEKHTVEEKRPPPSVTNNVERGKPGSPVPNRAEVG
jgi:hypothetical protein